MKVTLICPRWAKGFNNISFLQFPSQSLVQLASLTPADWEVEIVDESRRPINFDAPTDLVALTGMTALAPRAYEIAAEFRRRRVPVVMGGIHASMCPQEVACHVDCVVTGEADEVWPRLLRDFENGQLLPRYDCATPGSLDFPRARQVSRTFAVSCLGLKVRNAFIQAQRGCPNMCEFCSVRRFNGSVIRHKTLPYLAQEIHEEKQRGFDYLCFVDDNLVANRGFARQLFATLNLLGIRWLSQMDIRIAGEAGWGGSSDEAILDQACESGMCAVMLGLESVDPGVLKTEVRGPKQAWRRRYEIAIKKLRDRGIFVYASFIFGFDGESRDTVPTTVKWAQDNGIDIADFCILTPLPGTSLFEKLAGEGRILTYDWARYNTHRCVIRPIGQSPEELTEQVRWANTQFYSWPSIFSRINRQAPLQTKAISLSTNVQFRAFRK